MLEELMNKVRQFGENAVVANPAIPNQQNENVIKEAGNSIFSSLKHFAEKGDVNSLSGALDGNKEHPAVQQVQSSFADNIMRKFGIPSGNAFQVADGLIPAVLGSLVNRGGNNSGLSLPTILASLTGGNGAGAGMLSGLGAKLGLDKDGDGDVDLQDLTKMFGK